jgi:hypothetical protein
MSTSFVDQNGYLNLSGDRLHLGAGLKRRLKSLALQISFRPDGQGGMGITACLDGRVNDLEDTMTPDVGCSSADFPDASMPVSLLEKHALEIEASGLLAASTPEKCERLYDILQDAVGRAIEKRYPESYAEIFPTEAGASATIYLKRLPKEVPPHALRFEFPQTHLQELFELPEPA